MRSHANRVKSTPRYAESFRQSEVVLAARMHRQGCCVVCSTSAALSYCSVASHRHARLAQLLTYTRGHRRPLVGLVRGCSLGPCSSFSCHGYCLLQCGQSVQGHLVVIEAAVVMCKLSRLTVNYTDSLRIGYSAAYFKLSGGQKEPIIILNHAFLQPNVAT